jgi:hypothetical protein
LPRDVSVCKLKPSSLVIIAASALARNASVFCALCLLAPMQSKWAPSCFSLPERGFFSRRRFLVSLVPCRKQISSGFACRGWYAEGVDATFGCSFLTRSSGEKRHKMNITLTDENLCDHHHPRLLSLPFCCIWTSSTASRNVPNLDNKNSRACWRSGTKKQTKEAHGWKRRVCLFPRQVPMGNQPRDLRPLPEHDLSSRAGDGMLRISSWTS